MTHAEFRKMQALMDEAGLITCIRTIRVSKTKVTANVKQFDFDGKPYGTTARCIVYRYKYRYEVLMNGEIVKTSKTRQTAKKFLIDYYTAKQEFEAAQAKFLRTKKRQTK